MCYCLLDAADLEMTVVLEGVKLIVHLDHLLLEGLLQHHNLIFMLRLINWLSLSHFLIFVLAYQLNIIYQIIDFS